METEFELLIETLKKFDGFILINSDVNSTWIHFKIMIESSLSEISNEINEIKDHYPCSLSIINNPDNMDDFSYQLIIEAEDRIMAMKVLTKKLINILENQGDERKALHKELGLPDLSLVTLRQIATELKNRHNLIFALVWIENNERDNIAIEGSGNPTQLVGLLTRGSHMAIEWADKNIKFYRPDGEE